MSEPDYEPTDGPSKESSSSYDTTENITGATSPSAGRMTRRSATRKSVEFDLVEGASGRAGSSRHSSRLTSASSSSSLSKEEKDTKKVVAVKPSMAPVQELGNSYPDWSVLERELEAAKTLENAYFLDSSFLHALTAMDLWLSSEGPFFMPRREFRHRHCIFNLFWQPSAPNWEKSEYVVPPRLTGLLRWYLTRDNFIKYVRENRSAFHFLPPCLKRVCDPPADLLENSITWTLEESASLPTQLLTLLRLRMRRPPCRAVFSFHRCARVTSSRFVFAYTSKMGSIIWRLRILLGLSCRTPLEPSHVLARSGVSVCASDRSLPSEALVSQRPPDVFLV